MIKLNSIASKMNGFGNSKVNLEDSNVYWRLYFSITHEQIGTKETYVAEQTVWMVSLYMTNNTYTDCKGQYCVAVVPYLLRLTLSWCTLSFEAWKRWLLCVCSSWYCFGFSFFHQIHQEKGISALCGPRAQGGGRTLKVASSSEEGGSKDCFSVRNAGMGRPSDLRMTLPLVFEVVS